MPAFFQRRSVRICRVVFRWIRICVWLLILAVVALAGYLHWVGLPDWLKKPILAHLRERGYQAQFSRMRLGWGPAVIVENASFQRLGEEPEPRLSAARADLELTLVDLAHARVALKALEVQGARLRFPPAGSATNFLSLDNVQFALLFTGTNVVSLTNASAGFRGVRLTVNGQLEHAEAVRDWKFLRPARAKTSWQVLLARVTEALDQIHFAEIPRIVLTFSADARDLDTAKAHLSFGAPDVTTPWGDARRIRLEASCRRPFSTNETILHVALGVEEAATRWGHGSAMQLTATISRDDQFNLASDAQFTAEELDGNCGTNAAQLFGLRWDGAVGLNGTNFHFLRAAGDLRAANASSSWGTARGLDLRVDGEAADPPAAADASWGFWAKLAGGQFRWSLAGSDIATSKLNLDSVSIAGDWRAPVATISRFETKLYDGSLSGHAQVDVSTREFTANAHADFDERRVTQLLTPAAQHWLAQYEWKTPPDVHAQLRMVLPAWTNRHPDWAGEVRPTLQMAGDFSARDGSFRGVPVDRAASSFGYTNRVWTLPRLQAWRGDGEVEFAYSGSDATHEYHFLVDAAIDPKAAETLLPEAQRHWFNEAAFRAPPKIHAEVWGQWKAPELIGIKAEVLASNFVAHGEKVDLLACAVDYTNGFFRVHDARVITGSEYGTVGLAEVDLKTKRIFLTNALGSVSPDLIRRVCAPRRLQWLELIEFDLPPAVRVAGSFRIGDPLATDLGFEVRGQRFHFTNIVADKVSGGVRWQGRHVALTNIAAALYSTGALVGGCAFDWDPKRGTDFNCNLTAKDIDLPVLARGLTGRTNKLEGMLDGDLIMDRSNSHDRSTWRGLGEVHVHNALLWDIKIFGIFSPMLNAISPGSGESRAYEASAHFAITNGVVATDDLAVRATGFRLLYRGSINIVNKQIDARAEAELLRDTWVFGPFLSAFLSPLSKLFEYKVTGDLHNPKSEPLFIPQPLMAILHPFHSLKNLGAGSSENSPPSETAPPGKK